jgi:hypothetical protein
MEQQNYTQEKKIETPVSNQYVTIKLRYDGQEELYWRGKFFYMWFDFKGDEVRAMYCFLGAMHAGDVLSIKLNKLWNEEKGVFKIYHWISSFELDHSFGQEDEGKTKLFSRSQILSLTGVLKVFEEHFPGALKGKIQAGRARKIPNIPYKVDVVFTEEGPENYRQVRIEEGNVPPSTKEQDRKDALSLLEKSVFPYMANQTLVDRIKNLLQ